MSTPEPGSRAVLDPEGITQPVSTMRVGIGYQVALFLGHSACSWRSWPRST